MSLASSAGVDLKSRLRDVSPHERGAPQTEELGTDRAVESEPRAPQSGKKACAADCWLARCLLRGMGDPPVRLVLWSGEQIAAAGRAPVAGLRIRDRVTLWRLAQRPLLEFGEAYSSCRVEVEGDLLDFLLALYGARHTSHRGAWSRWAGARNALA